SAACDNCYMFAGLNRAGQDPTQVRRTTTVDRMPLGKTREGQVKIRAREKVFTCSYSDWFHEDADPWRPDAWEIIRQRRDVTFQIVTKRIGRAAKCLPPDWGNGWPNVWLIVTVENQEWLEKRVHHLLQIPA